MFNHIMLGADDIDAARAFYDATLGALGVPPGALDPKGRVGYRHNGGRLVITRPINGAAASHANGGTLGFAAPTTDAVDAWHAAGLANGGTSCEDPPGVRELGAVKMYLAYLRDPTGNKLCAVHHLT